MRVLGLTGSLRSGSLNRELLRLASGRLPPGVDLAPWDGLASIPPYDGENEDAPPAPVAAFRDAVAAADAVLVVTPEYNHSIPGQLKNALDWASRPRVRTGPFRDKPVAVIGASTGSFGGVWGQEETRKVLRALGARVVDAQLPVAKARERLSEPDDELLAGLEDVLARLAAEAAPARRAA